ncbi:MAG: formate dehydrogenase subunit delta [Rubellimicrobium sp.]|nr:formate dehydrogenase subunit delta [Rubellimicrobium sp.]
MTDEKMIHMANQIAAFFETQPEDAVAAVADHLEKFWEARMKAQLYAHVDRGGKGLHDSVIAAVTRMRETA